VDYAALVDRLLLVANPSASGFTGGMFRRISAMLAARYQIQPAWPENPEEARAAAATAAAEGFDIVVAFGGDGVVHHVANGLAGTDTSLGIVPAGTTNVLARILGIPNHPRKAADLMLAGSAPERVPLARIDLDGRTSYATFATGIGYDAAVVERSDQEPYRKYWFGSVHYARSAASTLLSDFRKRQPNLRADWDRNRADAVTVLVQVHTPYTYFGRLPLGASSGNTGLTVIVFERLPLRRAPRIVYRAIRGSGLERSNGVDTWRNVDRLTVTADPAEAVQADGELLGRASSVVITAAPEALRVIVPSP
jgi:diacylglycerol kinase family enzyme